MKIARFFAVIFAVFGFLLLVGSIALCLVSMDAPTRVLELPQEAAAVSDAFVRALNEGDLESAAGMMYGEPDLGVSAVPENPESAILWDAFRGSIVVTLDEKWALEQDALVRTGTVTSLDVSAILGKLPEHVQSLMDRKIASAENMTDIYDENNDFRKELVDAVLEEALQQALSEDARTVTRNITLKLVNRDGRWWVVPHQNLLQTLTGLT